MVLNKTFSYKKTFLVFLTYLILFVFFYNSNVKAVDCSSTYSSSATFSAHCTVPSGGTTINNGVTITTGRRDFVLNTGDFVNNGTITSTDSYTVAKNSAGSAMTNFTNTGTISSETSGYQVSFQNGARLTNFNNSGTISTNRYGMLLSNNVVITNFTNSGTITTSSQKALLLQINSSITNFYNTGTISGGGSNADIGLSSDSSIVNFYNDQPDLEFYGKNPDNYYIQVNSTSDYGTLKAHSTDAMTFAGIESSSSLSVGTYSNVVTNISSSYISATSGTFGEYNWSFVNSSGNNWDLVVTTPDTTAPTLSSSTPADNASSVARDANIVLNFSESVTVQTGNITIKKTSDNSTVETFNVATSGQVTGTGTSQITINPSSDLFGGFEYYVLIDATAFDDSASNSYAGISSTTALTFTVVAMQDPTTNKDVVGSIDTQSSQIQSTFIKSISTVSTRLSYLRQNRSNDNFAKNNIKLEGDNVMLTSLVKTISNSNTISPKLNLTKLIPDNWSPWSEGSISLSKIKNNSSEIESQSLAFGFDRKLNNNNLLGFAIQYGQSDTDVGTNGTGIYSKNYNLSLYQTRPLNDDNFIEGLIGVGIIEKDLTRKSGSNTLTGSRDGAQIFGSINYGKTIDKGDFNLTPIARVDLGYTELDAYTETGTDALSYDKQTVESGMVSLGLEFNDIIKFSNSSFKPFGLVEYGLDFSNSSDVQMNYVSDTSTTYTYTQTVNSTHLLTSEVGFNYEALENLNIKTSYKRIQGNENEHIDTVKFAFKFKSRRETEYAMSLDGSEDLKTGFDITKNINGFDLNFNANQSFNETSDQAANVSLSRSF
jgi:methionine-rich copper-binding protein CopC